MIGTIRKHSGWLWALIITATIISFVFWGTSSARVGGSSSSNLGTVYGVTVTPDQYVQAKKDFYLSYWFHSGHWPDETAMTSTDMDQQIYLSIMLSQKAEQMGIHVSEDAAAQLASERLAALGRNGQTVSLDALVEQALAPKGFNAADFERYIRNDLMIQELIQALGLPGKLITPQEAAAAYLRENEELSAQAVFFSSSNYFSAVHTTPAVLGQFYTNFQAHYRLPDRVQVDYVAFDVTNYLGRSRTEWAKTNLTEMVDSYFAKLGPNYKGAKTPAEARTNIMEELIQSRASADAHRDANDLATAAFGVNSADAPKPENLSIAARQKGVAVHRTEPFAKTTGPQEFDGSGNFTKTAFDLTPDSPLGGPVTDGDVIYVIALVKTLPSEIPSYDEIKYRVALDYQMREANQMAQQAGSAFYHVLTNQMASGRSFASACVINGHRPETLPAFSIATQDMPELGDRATIGQIKQVAFTTAVGKPSPFEPTQDGGFILYVQSKLPVDKTKMTADLPEFTQTLRRSRQSEAFNQWLQTEATGALKMPK